MTVTGVNAEHIVHIVSYTTASLVLVAGMVVLFNIFPASVPDNIRIILGAAMVLYGTYRIWMMWRKQRNARENNEN